MILSGKEILARLGEDIIIEPFDEKQINSNSYNLKLHNELLVYKDHELDMKKDNGIERIIIGEEGFLLEPGRIYLARTLERLETHNLVPFLEGRSSIGRLGLHVHITAGLGQVGSKGYWTLELQAIQPLRIYPGIQICQIYFSEIKGDFSSYSNKYFNSRDIQSSLLFKEFE